MEVTTNLDGLRRALRAKQALPFRGQGFRTGLEALDGMAPNGVFQWGAVHELLSPKQPAFPTSFALLLAKAAQINGGALAWSDSESELYLPALSAAGIDLRHLMLLRCGNRADQLWALAQCLRCRGIGASIAFIPHLSQVEARRLQLAAECGGGVGLFMRPYQPEKSVPYAAATRWLVQAAPGDGEAQRWNVELLHGHGGRIGKVLLLEVDRETRHVRASEPVADRPAMPASARATA